MSASRSTRSTAQSPTAILAEKPIASADGVYVFIVLAEQVLFLQGFDEHDSINQKVLQGTLNLQVMHDIKVQDITLRFRGVAKTVWPEPWRVCHLPPTDVEDVVKRTWPFFGVRSQNSQLGHGADHVFPFQGSVPMKTAVGDADDVSSFHDNIEEIQPVGRVQMTPGREYHLFTPGDYIYNFELPLSSRLPETIKLELGTVKYELEASIVHYGRSSYTLKGSKKSR